MTKNFKQEEFLCTGKNCGPDGGNCGSMNISPTVVLIWQMVRDHFDKPVKINSGTRCEIRNKQVGGANNSQHKPKDDGYSHAADGYIDGVTPQEIGDYIRSVFPNSLGVGVYKTFVHIDDRMDRAYNW